MATITRLRRTFDEVEALDMEEPGALASVRGAVDINEAMSEAARRNPHHVESITNVTPIDPQAAAPSAAAETSTAPPGWEAELTTNREGRPKATLGNVNLILRNDESYLGRFAFNEMSAAAELDGKTMTDADFAKLRIALERRCGMAVTTDTLVNGICAVADEQKFQPGAPVPLESLAWDAEPRDRSGRR